MRLLTIGFSLLSAAPAVAQQTGIVEMQVGDQSLQFPLPMGFCEPASELRAYTQAMAASDPVNVTTSTLVACNRGPSVVWNSNYVLIKAPTRSLQMRTTKAEALPLLEAVFTGPDAPKFDEAMTNEIGNSTERTLGTRLEVRGAYGFAGRDADCVYLAGPLQVESQGKKVVGQVGSCITVAGGKLLTVNVYYTGSDDRIAALKASARDIAVSIRPS